MQYSVQLTRREYKTSKALYRISDTELFCFLIKCYNQLTIVFYYGVVYVAYNIRYINSGSDGGSHLYDICIK